LAATILSAQCTDKRVNEVTPGLFKKYPTITDFANANPAELGQDIRSTGFFNNKSKSLIGAARKILADFSGRVPQTMEEMLTIPGAARKTSNVVLGAFYGIAAGVVVDTHVQRVSPAAGFDQANRSRQNRAGSNQDSAEGKVDRLSATTDFFMDARCASQESRAVWNVDRSDMLRQG